MLHCVPRRDVRLYHECPPDRNVPKAMDNNTGSPVNPMSRSRARLCSPSQEDRLYAGEDHQGTPNIELPKMFQIGSSKPLSPNFLESYSQFSSTQESLTSDPLEINSELSRSTTSIPQNDNGEMAKNNILATMENGGRSDATSLLPLKPHHLGNSQS